MEQLAILQSEQVRLLKAMLIEHGKMSPSSHAHANDRFVAAASMIAAEYGN